MASRDLADRLPQLVDTIVASYDGDARTRHIDRRYLPSRSAAVVLCDLLLEVTYPGYFGRHDLTRHNVAFHVGDLLPRLYDLLLTQIQNCLCHQAECRQSGSAPPPGCEEEAAGFADRFVAEIPAVRAQLADDVQAHYDGDPAAVDCSEIVLAYPGLFAITIHRFAHLLYRWGVPFLPRMLSEHVHQRTGIDVHPGARIGRRFCIDHGTGVVIGETAEIGDNVKIYQGVTLGALSFERDKDGRLVRGTKRHPTVGNDVTIYANAIILGGRTEIGDGAVIGGSVFLTYSIKPGHQVTIANPILRVRPPREERRRPADEWSDWII